MLRAGKGGVEFLDHSQKRVRFEAGAEVDAAALPPGTKIDELIAGGILERDTAGEVKTAVEEIAYHAAAQSVYHTLPGCKVGNNIEAENRVAGTGGKKLCKECARG